MNQLWAADITNSPIGRGFLYLVAIIDWASRAVLSWRLSNTMDVSFCIAALQEALAKYGAPNCFNTDQGSQFTSTAFTECLSRPASPFPSTDAGRWMDNVFIERLWRSLKREDIYLKGYADGGEARAGIAAWMEFYNHRRLHQALDYQAPMAVRRDAMAKANAVDMMDNADALTTCPQPKRRRHSYSQRDEAGAAHPPTKKPPQAVPLRGSISGIPSRPALNNSVVRRRYQFIDEEAAVRDP